MDRCMRLNPLIGLLNKSLILLLILICVTCASSNFDIKNVSKRLSEDLEELKNRELGAQFLPKLYGSFKDSSDNSDLNKSVVFMAQKLRSKIIDIFDGLLTAKATLIDMQASESLENIPSTFIPCVQNKNDNNRTTILLSIGFLNYNNTFSEQMEVSYVLQNMRRNINIRNAIKQQYFISQSDVESYSYSPFSECTGHDDTILWHNYRARNSYIKRNVILILDHGGSLSKMQLQIVKSVAKEMINSLGSDDRVALIAISSVLESAPNTTTCSTSNESSHVNSALSLLKLTNSLKQTLHNFIDSLVRGNGVTNHTLGIQQALDLVKETSKNLHNESFMILYISRGLLSSLTEARLILSMIEKATENIQVDLTINTCAVIDESKSVMYETHFLQDIAEQSYFKYNISFTPNKFVKPGMMLTINSSDNVGFIVTKFNTFFYNSSFVNTGKMLSLPNWDSFSKDLSVSFSIGWSTNDNFIALGTDVYFSNLAEDVTYYSSNPHYSYAFLMNFEGQVLVHPSLPRASTITYQPAFVDISLLEKVYASNILRKKLITEHQGTFTTTGIHRNNLLKYHWTRVESWYVICIVVNTQYKSPNRPFRLSRFPSVSSSKLIYHNLFKQENYKLCRHLNQLATLDAASLYLGMSCFQSPFSASRTSQDKLIVQAYLKDDTRLLANPGLKDDVRDEVAALAHIMDFLKTRQMSSLMSKYIIRRFAASHSGVLQLFPGSILGPGLEPTKRPWFLQAMKHQGKLILIPPYLDNGGAGYIVTIAFATSKIVVGLDITFGYMLKLLLGHMPFCLDSKVTCFMMDDRGYLIYHPNLMDVNGARPVEQQHIVHKESLVANDILNHKQFIQKQLCNNYGDSTIQRYYKVNTSFDDVLANFIPGEHCVTYKIALVPNTNIFVGVVNATCDVVATFCPCSVVDRLCLNCNRMEQKECECPCECPLNFLGDDCSSVNKNITDSVPCNHFNEHVQTDVCFISDADGALESCFPYNCQEEQTFNDCLGVAGCEWCKFDIDSNLLRKPFCASMMACFNGFLGAAAPYRDGLTVPSLPDDSDYSPMGPILGSVIAMCVLFILLFVCYRSYTSPSTERLYFSSTQDNQLRMSDLNVNDNFHDLDNNKLLQEDRPNPVSPYCVASSYRRPPTAAESDHGYSTMTPHDESEHLSVAPIDLLEDDLTSDSTSIHTSISNKHNSPSVISPPMFTRIPHRNCIVVPVTVHRNMETT